MLNKNLFKINNENAFSRSARIVQEYKKQNPDADIISLGIGDVSKPIIEPIRNAMKKAVDDLGSMDSFVGYGLYCGLKELRQTIIDNDYSNIGFTIDEVFVGDGTKSDSTNILELFDENSKILIADPMYPIYQNGAYALSRNVIFGDVDDEFKLMIPHEKYDIIYLCSPSNPVGNALTKDELKDWINYAIKNQSVILLDNVYRSFVESEDVPNTVYEIEDAKRCVIELRSFSKDASFTSMRCSYFVIPKQLCRNANEIWKERTINRFNGASYVSQMGAIASYLPESQELIKENIKAYKENTRYLKNELIKLGFNVIGGVDSPYLWVETPGELTSWQAFAYFLKKLNIVTVPGEIFGSNGLYYLRLSGLGTIENSKKAIERIKKYYEENI